MRARVGAHLLVASVLTFAAGAQAQEEPEAPPPPPVAPEGAAPAETTPEAPAVAPPPPTPVVVAPAPAAGPRFGARGEYVVTAASAIGLSSLQYAKSATETFSITFSPGLDVFVARGFSLGVDLDVGYDVTKRPPNAQLGTTKTTTLALGPRFGLNIPLGERFSFYPRVGFGFSSISTTSEVTGMPERSDSERTITVSAFAPVLFHAAPHFFFGAGPSFNHRFPEAGHEGELTTAAGRILVGGWWGGGAKDETAAAPEADDGPRFGDRGQWVFTGDVGGRVAHTGGSTSSTVTDDTATTVSISPGVDVFIVPHLSLGAAALIAYSDTKSRSRTTLGVGPRVGAEIPLGRSFSLYPRLLFSYVHVLDEASASPFTTVGGAATSSSGDIFALTAYVPVLAHVAPHFFIGFGPSLYHELSRTFGTSSGDLATRVGASLEVGGWL